MCLYMWHLWQTHKNHIGESFYIKKKKNPTVKGTWVGGAASGKARFWSFLLGLPILSILWIRTHFCRTTMRGLLLLFPQYKWRIWGTERISNLAQVQVINPGLKLTTLHHTYFFSTSREKTLESCFPFIWPLKGQETKPLIPGHQHDLDTRVTTSERWLSWEAAISPNYTKSPIWVN